MMRGREAQLVPLGSVYPLRCKCRGIIYLTALHNLTQKLIQKLTYKKKKKKKKKTHCDRRTFHLTSEV